MLNKSSLQAKVDNIQTFKTTEINEHLFKQFVSSFNEVMNRNFDVAYFKNKYYSSSKKYSYHSLVIEDDKVVASLAAIPHTYYSTITNTKYNGLLLVDFFVAPAFRKDALLGAKLYKKLISEYEPEGIDFFYALPNDQSVNYWIKLLKFKVAYTISLYVLFAFISSGILSKTYRWFLCRYIDILLLFEKKDSPKKLLALSFKEINKYQKYIEQDFFVDNLVNGISKLDEVFGKSAINIFQFANHNDTRKDFYIYSKHLLQQIRIKQTTFFLLYTGSLPFKQLLFFKKKLDRRMSKRNFNIIYKIINVDNAIELENLIQSEQSFVFSCSNLDIR